MKVIPGDILLFESNRKSSLLDRAIAWGQKVVGLDPLRIGINYCHVGVVGPDDKHFYEAAWPRVRQSPLELDELFKSNPVDIFRVRDLATVQLEKVMAHAQSHLGQMYDLGDLIFGLFPSANRVVCSTFVWQCFNKAGIELCPASKLESPDDLAASPFLTRIFWAREVA